MSQRQAGVHLISVQCSSVMRRLVNEHFFRSTVEHKNRRNFPSIRRCIGHPSIPTDCTQIVDALKSRLSFRAKQSPDECIYTAATIYFNRVWLRATNGKKQTQQANKLTLPSPTSSQVISSTPVSSNASKYAFSGPWGRKRRTHIKVGYSHYSSPAYYKKQGYMSLAQWVETIN